MRCEVNMTRVIAGCSNLRMYGGLLVWSAAVVAVQHLFRNLESFHCDASSLEEDKGAYSFIRTCDYFAGTGFQCFITLFSTECNVAEVVEGTIKEKDMVYAFLKTYLVSRTVAQKEYFRFAACLRIKQGGGTEIRFFTVQSG